MDRYNPEATPDPEQWLALDEGERIYLVESCHRDARVDLPKAARALHASIHVVVENQLALNDEPVVRAFARLRKQGLSRHDAVHAIGSVVGEHLYELLNEKNESPDTSHARYYAAIERLTAETWRDGSDD